MLIIGLMQTDSSVKESCGKEDLVTSNNLGYFKTIFAMLAKVIALYIRFFEVHIQKPNF